MRIYEFLCLTKAAARLWRCVVIVRRFCLEITGPLPWLPRPRDCTSCGLCAEFVRLGLGNERARSGVMRNSEKQISNIEQGISIPRLQVSRRTRNGVSTLSPRHSTFLIRYSIFPRPLLKPSRASFLMPAATLSEVFRSRPAKDSRSSSPAWKTTRLVSDTAFAVAHHFRPQVVVVSLAACSPASRRSDVG